MGLPDSRVDEMLELVSLDQTEAKRRLRNYSLGMKQRLGIAHALLGDPSVLILDEPANGLDPAGIRWMRGLLKGYADRGGTVLLSSHLLNEVEQIADEMILIGRGKIVASGTKDELLSSAEHKTRSSPRSTTSCSPRRCSDKGLDRLDGRHRSTRRGPARRGGHGSPPSGAIVLTDLRSADGGLEELFLDAHRGLPARRPPVAARTTHRRSPGMSTLPRTARMQLDVSGTPRVPMSRLVRVEMRKALDTRAGRWLVIAILGLWSWYRGDLRVRGQRRATRTSRTSSRSPAPCSATSCRSSSSCW